jgi:hypothetical protein
VGSFLALTLILIGAAPVAMAQVYDANADFDETAGNPNGVWTYAWSDGVFGAQTALDFLADPVQLDCGSNGIFEDTEATWISPAIDGFFAPSVGKAIHSGCFDGIFDFDLNDLLLNAGGVDGGGAFVDGAAHVVFTAPADMSCSVSASFSGRTVEQQANAHVLVNGGEVWTDTVMFNDETKSYPGGVHDLFAGDTVAFSLSKFDQADFMSGKVALDATVLCQPRTPLDHFKCYEVEDMDGQWDEFEVLLVDQFGIEFDMVGEPELICNPVSKNEEGIQNYEAHLVCYDIADDCDSDSDSDSDSDDGADGYKSKLLDDDSSSGSCGDGDDDSDSDSSDGFFSGLLEDDDSDSGDGGEGGIHVWTENQFGERNLLVQDPELLCVPSVKIEVGIIDPPDGGDDDSSSDDGNDDGAGDDGSDDGDDGDDDDSSSDDDKEIGIDRIRGRGNG